MKKQLFKYRLLLLIIFGLSSSINLLGQTIYPAEYTELWSDRSVYFSGENVLFTGVLKSERPENILSVVVYVELIAPDGQKISQAKLKLKQNNFHGKLAIPIDVLSGYYFIRAYTKWMRNGQPEDYAYVRIKIFNYLSDELREITDSLIDYSSTEKNAVNNNPWFHLNKEIYKPGEKLEVFDIFKNLDLYIDGCLSIIPAMAKPFEKPNTKKGSGVYSNILYYPETRGLTITGKVVSKFSQAPIPDFKVNLHFEDEKDFITTISDTAGNFYISLPERYGNKEIFVNAGTIDTVEIEVLIDRDFCNKRINLTVPSFSINRQDKKQLLLMAQSTQLSLTYQKIDSIKIETEVKIPFYGSPYKTIDFDSFVPLDSMSQYFTDLPSWVIVKGNKEERELYLSGGRPELQLYAPLILVDWVPIDDAELILALDPARIKKFDVIIHPYYHGGIVYGGILSIETRNSDFGGLTFPTSGMYINFNFYSYPDSSENSIQKKVYPFMNTYVWIPNLQSKSLQKPLEFTAPYTKGEYLLILQAIDGKGKNMQFSQKFTVE